ncbi:hypothetical protein C4D60_Mb06t26170 [Musa balbisiana]|uniref:Uncharacterized protein n=1 Tax=Musa balbisiana TaxID=52838 RepID=A0A4S8IT97_MUSBA|nr:hypothetical protein C4D60_Mb06t26170 [Musa balbisiana]
MIDNTTPVLNDDEYRDLRRLKDILPASRAIRNMTSKMVNLRFVREGRASLASSLRPLTEPRIGSKDAPVEVEAGRPRKKAKIYVMKRSDAVAAQSGGAATVPADRAGGASGRVRLAPIGRGRGRRLGSLPFVNSAAFPRVRRTSLTRFEQWVTSRRAKPPTRLARWGGLSRGEQVWDDGDSATLFIHGGLHPYMARELYTSSSEVLLGKSAKSLLWGQTYAMALMDCVRDAGRVISNLSDRNTELRRQIEEIRTRAAPEAVAVAEQRTSDLEVEATHLRSELKVAEEQNKGLQNLDEARVEARAASEALADEIRQWPEKDRKLIEAYKKSSSFEVELTRMGQVTYEYGYRIALARFRACYPDLEVTEDPFASFLEDLDVGMPKEVPFDDSVEVLEK